MIIKYISIIILLAICTGIILPRAIACIHGRSSTGNRQLLSDMKIPAIQTHDISSDWEEIKFSGKRCDKIIVTPKHSDNLVVKKNVTKKLTHKSWQQKFFLKKRHYYFLITRNTGVLSEVAQHQHSSFKKNSMKQIKTLVDLRQRIGISQDTMAEYLLVNRSTVSMAEIGTRSLPKEAVMKLAKLEACFAFVTNGKNAKKPLPFAEVDQQQWHKLATEWNFRILGNTRSKQQLVKQLQAMSNQFTNAVQWHRVVELLIAENAKKKTATTEQRWLNNQQAQAAGVMLVSGPPAQQMLQLKIDMLDADTALLQQYLQTYA